MGWAWSIRISLLLYSSREHLSYRVLQKERKKADMIPPRKQGNTREARRVEDIMRVADNGDEGVCLLVHPSSLSSLPRRRLLYLAKDFSCFWASFVNTITTTVLFAVPRFREQHFSKRKHNDLF